MQLGTYEVLRSLGKGSFGEVFLARDLSSAGDGQTVAVKRLRDTLIDDPVHVERLALEARICSRLRHPNIVQVHGFVESPDGYLLVMEHLEGVELRRVIQLLRRRNRLLHPGIAIDLVIQLCRGLHFAHVAADVDGNPLGLVHRDVKPGNLMITREGQLKVMDFGVARVDFARTRTSLLSVKGTLQYMAPEQAAGLAIDARVDQFATGLILAELLLGHPVYQSPNDASLYFQVGTAAVGPALEEVARHYPRVAPIAERALALVPEDRYPNQLEMAEALLEVLPAYQPAPPLGELVTAVLTYETDLSRWSRPTPTDLLPGAHDDSELDRLRALATRLEEATSDPTPVDSAGAQHTGRDKDAPAGPAESSLEPRTRELEAPTPGGRPRSTVPNDLETAPGPHERPEVTVPAADVDPDARTERAFPRPEMGTYADEITASGIPEHIVTVPSNTAHEGSSQSSQESPPSTETLRETAPADDVNPGQAEEVAGDTAVFNPEPDYDDVATVMIPRAAPDQEDSRTPGEEAWFQDAGGALSSPADDAGVAAIDAVEGVEPAGESKTVKFLFALLVVLAIGVPLILLRPWMTGVLPPPTSPAHDGGEQAVHDAPSAKPRGQTAVSGANKPPPVTKPSISPEDQQPAQAAAAGHPSATVSPGEVRVSMAEKPKPARTTPAKSVAPATASPAAPAGKMQQHPKSKVMSAKVPRRGVASERPPHRGTRSASQELGGQESGDQQSPVVRVAAKPEPSDTRPEAAPEAPSPRPSRATPAPELPAQNSTGLADSSDSVAEEDASPANTQTGKLVLRVIPGDSAVQLEGRDVRDACWDGCTVAAGKHIVEVVHPDGRTRTFTLTIPTGQTRRCLYRFDLSEPLQCR